MSPRKYNVQHKREKKKEEIIRAAVRLFMERGFDRVSLSDIADSIDLGRTTLYEYFRNKNEILSSYLEKEMLIYHEKVMAVISKRSALKNKLIEFIAIQLEYGSYHKGFSQLFRSLSRSSKDISASTEAVIRKKHQDIYAALSKEFDVARRKKEIRDVPPHLVMQLLINATSFPLRSNMEPLQTAKEVFSVFWSGISMK